MQQNNILKIHLSTPCSTNKNIQYSDTLKVYFVIVIVCLDYTNLKSRRFLFYLLETEIYRGNGNVSETVSLFYTLGSRLIRFC